MLNHTYEVSLIVGSKSFSNNFNTFNYVSEAKSVLLVLQIVLLHC